MSRFMIDSTGNITVPTDSDGDGVINYARLAMASEITNATDALHVNDTATATAAGLTTGTLTTTAHKTVYVVTSANAAHFIKLPAPAGLEVGDQVVLMNGATGYKLITTDPETIAINGGAEADAETDIGASTLVTCTLSSATTWVCLEQAAAGTPSATTPAAAPE